MGDADGLSVTVITPCLNASEWLPRCIESVKAQAGHRVEHIVVDGGSTDGTVDILRSEPHILWTSEPDEGQSDAINKGIARATGTLTTWLNADDMLEPGAVESVLRARRARPDGSVFYGDCAIAEAGTRRLWTPPPAIRVEDFDNRFPLPQVGTFVSTRALNGVGGVDARLHLAMDFDLFLRLVLAGHRFVYTGQTLATFVLHSTSKSGANVHGEFLREEAQSLGAAGRREAASVALGRASALAAQQPGGWRPGYWHEVRSMSLPEQAGAHLEATRVLAQSKSILPALGHVVQPAIWRCGTTRRALTRTAGRLPQRVLHRRRAGA